MSFKTIQIILRVLLHSEYLLYGDQENEYILELLKKKAGKNHPMIEEFILQEVKQAKHKQGYRSFAND